MLEKLPIGQLQNLIGAETLERITKIIPAIPNSGIDFADDVYQKQNLIKIFEAFSGSDKMYSRDFRKTLFSYFSEKDIDEMCSIVSIPTSGDFKNKVERLSKLSWGNNTKTKALIEFLGLPTSYVPQEVEAIPNIETIRKPDASYKTLLDFQNNVYLKSLSALSPPYARFIIQMPTGSGKTRTTMEIITKILNENPDKSIVWLAHSEELCEQAVQCFKEVWEHVGKYDIDLMRVWGSNDLQKLRRTSFVVAGLQKLYSIITKGDSNYNLVEELSSNISLIVVDEAHKSIAPTYKYVIDVLSSKNNNVKIIGLTATPGRGNIISSTKETEELLNYYHNNIIEIDSGEMDVFPYLRQRGILSKMIREPLQVSAIISLTDSELRSVEKFYDYPEGFLKRLANNDARNIEIILKLKEVCDKKKKTIFFASSLEHSKFICAILVFLGYKAEHIDGSTRRERRSEIISNFKEGDLDVICNYGVLTTGFDAPKTDVVFIARPTLSVILYSQMIGRGLRGPVIGGTETCTVVDVVDNITNYDSPDICYEYFKNYYNME